MQGPPIIDFTDLSVLNNAIGWRNHKTNIKGKTLDEIYNIIKGIYHWANFDDVETESYIARTGEQHYYRKFYKMELRSTEFAEFVSEVKQDSLGVARANMQVYSDEYLNLTFLNSVWVKYAILNRKVGGWYVGRCHIDYATSLKYLNKALEYLKEREKDEENLLKQYVEELPNEWQVGLSEWKMKNNYHSITDTRAKKFAKEVLLHAL